MFWLGGKPGDNDTLPVGIMQQWPSEGRPVVLVTLLDAAPERVGRAIRDHGGRRPWRAVFLTTGDDPRALFATGSPVEHLPGPAMVATSLTGCDWQAYLHERWRRVHQKWVPRWTVNYGPTFGEYLIRSGDGSRL